MNELVAKSIINLRVYQGSLSLLHSNDSDPLIVEDERVSLGCERIAMVSGTLGVEPICLKLVRVTCPRLIVLVETSLAISRTAGFAKEYDPWRWFLQCT